MKINTKLACFAALLFIHTTQGQNIQYDPLLDPAVKVLDRSVPNGEGEYLWYPGQLSAHLQQRRMQESAERCVNVGYPGKFYMPVFKASFRKEVNLSAETDMEWVSTGNIKLHINGILSDNANTPVKLPKGKSVLLFEVETDNNLPAVKISFNGQWAVDGWMASLDGTRTYDFIENHKILFVLIIN